MLDCGREAVVVVFCGGVAVGFGGMKKIFLMCVCFFYYYYSLGRDN